MFGERGIGPGQFINPTGVSVDCHGTLTVTDTQNNRVQQFALAAPPAPPCAALGAARQPAAAEAADAAAAARARSVSVRVLRTRQPVHDARAAAARRLRHRLHADRDRHA